MSLTFLEGMPMFRRLSIIALLTSALFIIGCSSSEEATEDTGTDQEVVAEQPQQEASNTEDQALTSFIGEKEPEANVEPAPVEPPKEEPAPEPPKVEEAQPEAQPLVTDNQANALREENAGLKEKLMKLEQDSQAMALRISEAEAKLLSETERANRAEESLKVVPPPTEAPKVAARGNYEEALGAFMAKRYDDALSMFDGILSEGAPKGLDDNCTYWLGESHYAKKQYAAAMDKFEAVLVYKVSEKKADAQYMIAQCLERTGKKADAKIAYEKVVKEYPMSALVKRAKERWARL
jgi:TolA-binding protein